MPDATITHAAVTSVPDDYLLPSGADLMLKAVTASFDGSGAASAYLPALQVLNEAGAVAWTAVPASSLVAGASADVTWFPAVGGSSTSGSGALMFARANIVGNQSITAGDPGQIVVWGEAPIDTGTPSAFWSNAHPSRLTCPANGTYLFLANMEWDVMHDDTDLGCYLYKNGSSIVAETFLSKFDANPVLSSSGAGSDSFTLIHQHHNIFSAVAGDYFELLAYVQPSAGIPASVNLIDMRPTLQLYSSFTMIRLG